MIKSYWQNYAVGPYDDDAGAIKVINTGIDQNPTEQALADTGEVDRAVKAEAVSVTKCAGQVLVDKCYADRIEAPVGGYDNSGYGREKGREAL